MAQPQLVYSFKDVRATLIGPGGTVPLGNDAGIAEEGITVDPNEEIDGMRIGADGSGAHSLRANKAGKITIRILKTSPTNALLQTMLNFQRISSLNWAQNVLVITNIATGDNYTCTGVAFLRQPPNTFAKDAGMIDWEFNATVVDPNLGTVLT